MQRHHAYTLLAWTILIGCERADPSGYGEPRHPDAEGAVARCEAELRDVMAPTREEREAMVEVACAEAYVEADCRRAVEAARELPWNQREEYMATACGAAYCPLITHLERQPYVCLPDNAGQSWLRWQEIKAAALTLDLGRTRRARIEHEAGRARLGEDRPERRYEPVFSAEPPSAEQVSRCLAAADSHPYAEALRSGGRPLLDPGFEDGFWEACLEVLWPRRCSDLTFTWYSSFFRSDALALLGRDGVRALGECATRYCGEPAFASASACGSSYDADYLEVIILAARLDWAETAFVADPYGAVAELFRTLAQLGFGQPR